MIRFLCKRMHSMEEGRAHMSLTWNNNLLTGVSKIDDQHMELFHAMNRLFDACNQGKGAEEIKHVFEFLDDYIRSHFNTEEEYMTKYDYPHFVDHRELHKKFKKDFTKLKRKLDKSINILSTLPETNWLLGEWWINHINNIDKKLGEFLKSKVQE